MLGKRSLPRVRTAERRPRRASSDRSRLNLSLTTRLEEMIRADTRSRLAPVQRSMPTLQWQVSYNALLVTFIVTSVCASKDSSHRTLRDSSSRAMPVVTSDLVCGCWCWCCGCCCGCIAWQVQHCVQRALVALSGLILFLSFFSSSVSATALVAARHALRRSLAVRKCGPCSIRIHQEFLHHTMCRFTAWTVSFARRVACVSNSSTPFARADPRSNFVLTRS